MSAPTSIALDYSHGGAWAVYSPAVTLDAGTHTSTDYIYIPNHGGIQNSIKCNKTTFIWSDNSSSGTPAFVITSGNYVYLGDGHDGTSGVASSNFTTFRGRFEIPTALQSTGSGGGTSTEGVATVEWQGSFTKNPGNDYWRWNVTGYNTEATDYISLYDYLPTLSSTEPPIGIRTFAASSSPTSQYGLFTPDLTKTYYIINYLSGGSSTNLNQQVLATKNFANKKVFCNFW